MRACAIAILLCLTVHGWAETYVVDQCSPGASDAGDGSDAHPFLTIGRGIAALKPGDTLLLGTGTYREGVTVAVSGTAQEPITIMAQPGAEVLITGADVMNALVKDASGRWSCDWPHRFVPWSKLGVHPEDGYHDLIGRCEQVMINNYSLQQVLRPDQVVPGTFCADTDGKRLWLQPRADVALTGPEGAVVEASTRDRLLNVTGAYVHVRGLRLRYAAIFAQNGMATFAGDHGLIEDCIFERSNAVGAHFSGVGIEARRCIFQDNGQLGFRAERAHDLHLVACTVRANNLKDFSRQFEAGGNKLVLCRGVVIERCRIEDNRGAGLWFDIGNEQCTVRNCLIRNNEDAGIFYEISYGLHAHDNVFSGNGFGEVWGSWGANGGISISSSPGCVVERNLFIGNRQGLQFRDFSRTTWTIDTPVIKDKPVPETPVWSHDDTVRNNCFAWNRDAQVWGYFDLSDERLWPAAMQRHVPDERVTPGQAAAVVPLAVPGTVPVAADISLETLHLTLDGNLFTVRPGQGLVNWGCPWRRNSRYVSLETLRTELGFEGAGSVCPALPFADATIGDYRLPADHPAIVQQCYPQGEVPGVVLGSR